MIQNNRENEKMNTKMLVSEAQRMHVVATLTEKINFITCEIEGIEKNIKLAQDRAAVLIDLLSKRKENLAIYTQRRTEIQAHTFEPVKDKIEILEEKLAGAGFTLEQLIDSLSGKKEEVE